MSEMLVFRLDKYNEDPYVQHHEENARWAVDCDGFPVKRIDNVYMCKGYVIDTKWCEQEDVINET